MKLAETIIKIGVAIAAIAGIAYLVVKYMDAIKAWAEKLCPCCAGSIGWASTWKPRQARRHS